MLVIAFHEFGHAITAILTGGKVKSIQLDPHEGGATQISGGISAITLPAGYLGSSLIGALLIFCGFDIVASKVASIVLGVCFVVTVWFGRRDWLTIVTVLMAVGLLIGFWFIAQAEALRFLVVSSFFFFFFFNWYISFSKYFPPDVCFDSFSSASCPRSTASGISATISSCAKSTRRTQASLRSVTAAPRSAGA